MKVIPPTQYTPERVLGHAPVPEIAQQALKSFKIAVVLSGLSCAKHSSTFPPSCKILRIQVNILPSFLHSKNIKEYNKQFLDSHIFCHSPTTTTTINNKTTNTVVGLGLNNCWEITNPPTSAQTQNCTRQRIQSIIQKPKVIILYEETPKQFWTILKPKKALVGTKLGRN